MQANRFQVYNFPHRAIRYALSELVREAGRVESTESKEWKDLQRFSTEVFRVLKIHARDEEAVSLTHLESRLPDSSQKDREEHADLEGRILELEEVLEESKDVFLFYDTLIDFQSRYFAHIRREEIETQSLLLSEFTVEELGAHQSEIMSSLSPEELRLWAKFLLPTLSEEQGKAFRSRIASISGEIRN